MAKYTFTDVGVTDEGLGGSIDDCNKAKWSLAMWCHHASLVDWGVQALSFPRSPSCLSCTMNVGLPKAGRSSAHYGVTLKFFHSHLVR